MAALAATRAAFVYPTEINGCDNYGYGGVCYKKRELEKRGYVATHGYLSMMSGAAGLSAIEMFVSPHTSLSDSNRVSSKESDANGMGRLFFIITLVVFSIHLRRARSSGKHTPHTNDKLEAHPMNPVAYEQSQQANLYAAPQPYTSQQQYDPPPQNYPQPPASQPYQGIEVQPEQQYTPGLGHHYG